MAGESKPRLMVAIALVVATLCAFGVWWTWFAGPPQLAADDKVFDAVDALFTAVRARDERLLRECEQRLRACAAEGKLAAPAVAYLNEVIEMARAGKWRPAAEKLYDFMKAQRRLRPSPLAV